MDNNVFTVKNLSFAYGKQQVLKHLDLELHEGKITTLIGANGCGKSTLFNLMTKNLRPDEGEILYALAVGVANQWDYMPAYNDLLPSTITMDFLTEVANATDVTIVTPNSMYLYDQTTGDKYVLGVDKGLLYYEEVEE